MIAVVKYMPRPIVSTTVVIRGALAMAGSIFNLESKKGSRAPSAFETNIISNMDVPTIKPIL